MYHISFAITIVAVACIVYTGSLALYTNLFSGFPAGKKSKDRFFPDEIPYWISQYNKSEIWESSNVTRKFRGICMLKKLNFNKTSVSSVFKTGCD